MRKEQLFVDRFGGLLFNRIATQLRLPAAIVVDVRAHDNWVIALHCGNFKKEKNALWEPRPSGSKVGVSYNAEHAKTHFHSQRTARYEIRPAFHQLQN